VVIDLFSRHVVGWSMQPSMHTDIVLSALTSLRRPVQRPTVAPILCR
jgi:transposase InsO family protein